MIQKMVFSLLQQIPKGKVTTYKILALKAGVKNPRTIGRIIHGNIDPEAFPCHRVVRSDGTVAEGYAFGGKKEQIKLLLHEGIKISNEKINLKKYIFNFQ